MAKVAKLVCVSLMTRVIVEDGLSEDDELDAIANQVRTNLVDKLTNDALGDHLESIELDEECPFGTLEGDE